MAEVLEKTFESQADCIRISVADARRLIESLEKRKRAELNTRDIADRTIKAQTIIKSNSDRNIEEIDKQIRLYEVLLKS